MRIWDTNQPQMYFTKKLPITVQHDRNCQGKELYVYQQGEDYIILIGLQQAVYLARMGFDVQLEEEN